MSAFVYLLHFDRPYKHARHYVGFTEGASVYPRITDHEEGRGARLMSVIRGAGIFFTVSRVWKFDHAADARAREKRIKYKAATRFCPICRPPRRPYRNGNDHDHVHDRLRDRNCGGVSDRLSVAVAPGAGETLVTR